MRWFSIFGRSGSSPDTPKAAANAAPRAGAPYSPQYEVIVGQGHDHPTPSFSAPALVWHVGVWPKKEHDPHDNPPVRRSDPSNVRSSKAGTGSQTGRDGDVDCKKSATNAKASIGYRRASSCQRRADWVAEIDAQLARMQVHRWQTSPPNPLKKFSAVGRPPLDAGSIVFTMWWKSPGAPEGPDPNAIRVKVHCNLTPDYVTYSFYMDVPTPWGHPDEGRPERTNPNLADILSAATTIRDICSKNETTKRPPYAQVEADDLTAEEDTAILDARNRLYVDIWERFIKDTGCTLEALAGVRGEVFANFRGVVLGIPRQVTHETPEGRFPRFSEHPRFKADGIEANTVVDAYWPLVRRIIPHADYREFVACGLLGWRAIYITALGSPAQYDENEERRKARADKTEADIRVHVGNQDVPADSCVRPRYDGLQRNHPVRYLMLTIEGLNPRQLGRIVERINALGTLRLYALKDWAKIVEADATIRILGQELDEITREWSEMRNLLEDYPSMAAFQKLVRDIRSFKRRKWVAELFGTAPPKTPEVMRLEKYLQNVDVPGRFRLFLARVRTLAVGVISLEMLRFFGREEASRVIDIKYGVLSEISRELETSLIEIGAELDRQGVETAGGLHFRVNRSAVHVAEFYDLLKLVQVGNIQTWTSYKQFVERGLEPAFAYIRSVGTRIHALRERLIAVLETIETSALVGQSSATRHNTGELRRIMSYVFIFIVAYLLLNKQELFEGARQFLSDVANRVDWSAVRGYLDGLEARLRR